MRTFLRSVLMITAAFVLSASLQPVHTQSRKFKSQVYVWWPNNVVRRASPGSAVSDTAAMPAGPFAQAHISPEGTSVVFWGGESGMPRIWLFDFGTASAHPVTPAETGASQPSFDWQGQRIVFARDTAASSSTGQWQPGNANLVVMSANGGDPRQITRVEFQDSRPAFSPDGKMIVFLSNRKGARRGLFIVPSDGSADPRPVVSDSGFARPWFSADGRFIYVTYFGTEPFVPEEHIRVWRISTDGSTREPVTPDGMPNSQGVFATLDGAALLFHSDTAYQFILSTHLLTRLSPPGFSHVWHATEARNGVRGFDSTDPDPTH